MANFAGGLQLHQFMLQEDGRHCMALAPLLLSLVVAATPASGLTLPAGVSAQSNHDVIYMEMRPSLIQDAVQQLRAWAHQQRRSRSVQKLVLLRELDRRNQFVVLASAEKSTDAAVVEQDQFTMADLAQFRILPNFSLDSEYMAGSKELSIPFGALVMVAHLDADPLQRQQTLLQLQKLGALIPELKGNQGVQILTWKKRTNHWTLISVWKDSDSYSSALEDPRIMKIRAAIASHAAAPADLRLYRRID